MSVIADGVALNNGLTISRVYTTSGRHPYDDVAWERTDVVLKNFRDGSVNFEQRGVEFPDFWSANARQIVTSKYFRGKLNTSGREWSLKQLINRVAGKYTVEGLRHGYFASESDSVIFQEELTYMLLHQIFSFNSPVWFNVGTKANQQCSACFILSVEDDMEAILDWYKEEGMIFRRGSGAGINLSRLRGSGELLSAGGRASGPVSFMRGADASAGSIASGGSTRRAAKMVVLDIDHPDIEEFISIKAREEQKIRALRAAGFDMDLGGLDASSVQYQNANNSVRVTDEFMQAVVEDQPFSLYNRVDGSVSKTLPARDLFHQISQAAWACADPGVQYDTTINSWHTNPNSGRISASNPCLRRGTKLLTDSGFVLVESLAERSEVLLWDGNDYVSGRVWHTGHKTLVRVTSSDGRTIDVTPDHRILTSDGWMEAQLCKGLLIPPADEWREPDYDKWPWVESVDSLDESDDVYDFSVPTTNMGSANGILVHNCSEYMSLDNSSCNLASLNLLKFLTPDGDFDSEKFSRAVEIIITAMDISVSFADFPTEKITEVSRSYRQLGLGYSNLGALLMAMGLAYDSDSGRSVAAAITSLMSAVGYRRSAELASALGSYAGYARNQREHIGVVMRHRDANAELELFGEVSPGVRDAACREWESAVGSGLDYGYRNAQISLLAPCGTISFMMDCDTTGVEPAFSLTINKKMHGGGSMQMVNQTVSLALRRLGYPASDIERIVQHILDHGHVVGAPALREEHYSVFDCAVGSRFIDPMGHVRMMAAVQPALSGAISKTINMPETSTVEDIAEVYMQGWRLGLKALAVYRDKCKDAQPLSSGGSAQGGAKSVDVVVESPPLPVRRRLPARRAGMTTSFEVNGASGYLTASDTEDGQLGEIFLKLGKQGSTLAGVMDAFAIAVSIGLQYGIPLETYVEKFTGMQFEPRGMTSDPEVRLSTSVLDYVFRRLALDYLGHDVRSGLGVLSVMERQLAQEPLAETVGIRPERAELPVASVNGFNVNAQLCGRCGVAMARAGVCWSCPNCGDTSGCS